MGTPFPNPQDGAAAKKSEGSGEGAGQRPSRDRRTSAQKRQQDILAMPDLQAHTKPEYIPQNIAGPSGIKQCYRAVKSVRRFPMMPAKFPETVSEVPGSSQQASKRTKSAKSMKTSEVPQPTKVLKKHSCTYCNKKFSSPGKLSQHVLSHTGELPFGCEHCDKKFNSKFKLVRHGLIHNDTRPFACLSCNKTFHRKDHLANHERIHNPTKNVYICQKESCRKQYTSLLSYKKHIALHSAEEGNLECKICSKTFENQADIVYHLKVHAGSRTVKNENDKKFDCSNCGRKFFTAKDVRRHLVVHTGRRDFLCQFCSQKFGRKDHLVRHVKKAHPDEQWQSATPGTSSYVSDQLDPVETVKDESPKKSIVKNEQSLSADVSTSQQVFHYDTGTETIILTESSESPQQEIYIECEQHDLKEHEDIPESIKLEDSYMFSPSKSVPLINPTTPVDPTPSTSKYNDPESYSMLFPILSNIALESAESALDPTEQPVESEHMMSSQMEIMEMLKSAQAAGGLPTFNQAFQNAAPSPKPPQHPPK